MPSSENWHVTPTNDLQPHEETADCHCNPRIEPQPNGSTIIIHNSFDGREMLEMPWGVTEA